MQLSDHSKGLLQESFIQWWVPGEYAQHVCSYLINGWHPGSFYTAVFANDFTGAMCHSHISNSLETLKNLSKWINARMPKEAWGSYDAVENWLDMHDEDRRTVLEQAKLIYDTKTEMWLILKNEHTSNPYEYTVL
jgi:hypothetical protein